MQKYYIIDYVMNSAPNFNSFEKFANLGRFVTIKFKNGKDALKLFVEKVKINVPLVNGKKGSPMICPGELLKGFINES